MDVVIARKGPRFAVQLQVGFKGDRQEGQGTILNISQEGCMVTADQTVKPATYLHLVMYLVEGQEPVEINLAAVRWAAKDRFGVEYIKVGPSEMERLKGFVTMLESPSDPSL